MARHPGVYVSDPGDPYLTAWILHWDWKQAFHDPLHLFDANIFYPSRLTLAFSENLFGVSVFGFPLYFAGLPALTVHGILFLLGVALSGLGAWALARELTGDAVASLIAGVFYAFVPWRFSQLPHIQLQWGPFLPLFLLFLWRYLRTGARRDLLLYAVFFAWNAIACIHYGIFGGFALAATVILELTRRSLWKSLQAARLAVATVASGIAILPFAIPYVQASRLYHFHRGLGEIVAYSATPKAFLSAGFRNKLYGAMTARFAAPEADLFFGILVPALAIAGLILARRRDPVERDAAPSPRGIVFLDALVVALAALRLLFAIHGGFHLGPLKVHEPYRLDMAIFAAVAVRWLGRFPRFCRYRHLGDWVRRRPGRPEVMWCVAMVLLGILIGFGGRFFFYRELYELLRPILGAVRAPVRGIVLAHLGIGVLAAFGISLLRRHTGRVGSVTIPFLAVALALLELRSAPISFFSDNPAPPPAIGWIAGHTFRGGLLEIPMKTEDNLAYVLWSTTHDHPIMNGYSGFFPKPFLELQTALAPPIIPASTRDLLRRYGVGAIMFHRGRATTEEQASIGAFLSAASTTGDLIPIDAIGVGAGDTVIFASPEAAGSLPSSPEDRARALAVLARPIPAPLAPEGWFYEPGNGTIFGGSSVKGSGWAAAREGIARIAILIDGRDVATAAYGDYRPDVPLVKPYVACRDHCGYSYAIEGVSTGQHTLGARYIGKNGGAASPQDVEIWVHP